MERKADRLLRVRQSFKKLAIIAALAVILALIAGRCGLVPIPGSGSAPETPSASGTLSVSFLDVGQGDSSLIRTPGNKFILIDGGSPGDDLVSKLRNAGVGSLDLIIVTHPHADHIGEIPEVLAEFDVNEIWTNGQEHDTALFERLIDAIDESGAKYTEVKLGHQAQIDQVRLTVLHPGERIPENINDASIVIKMQYGRTDFLFTGDAEHGAEAEMLRTRQNLQAEVLKVGHHGSTTSTSTPFLGAIRPMVAVWSAEEGNEYGHPHAVVLSALRAMGAKVYGTATYGTVTVSTDGRKIWVQTEVSGQKVEVGEAK